MPFKDNFKPISIAVEDGKDYSISVSSGNGIMLGSSSFFNFQNERISGTSITNSPLGKGADIKGKEILVKSTFEADNDATQFVSINYGVSYNNTESRSMPKKDDKFFTFHTKIKFL